MHNKIVENFITFIFLCTGDVLFSRLPHIYHLQINGSVDNRNAQEVIDGIIYKNQDFKLKNLIKFENQIKIDRNIRVKGQVNNINLPAFVSDMIMITKDSTILCPIQFAESVNIQNQMILHKKLSSKLVNDFDVKSWIDNAIFVNKGLLSGLDLKQSKHNQILCFFRKLLVPGCSSF